jgi:hypothetical protein
VGVSHERPLRDFQSDRNGAVTWCPGRLSSLLEMINYHLSALYVLIRALVTEENIWRHTLDSDVDDAFKSRVTDILHIANGECDRLQLDATRHRVDLFREKVAHMRKVDDFVVEMRALRETIEGEIARRYFYYYPQDKAELVRKFDSDWEGIAAFSDIRKEAFAAVDCFAMGHSTATVFHLMRAMEIGVQKFGQRLGVNLIKKNPGKRVSELNWENILNELNPKLRGLPQATLAQKRRHERYAAVQAHLYNVKDAWRNPTMHPRARGYNELQARDILNNVRSFMVELASLLHPKKN